MWRALKNAFLGNGVVQSTPKPPLINVGEVETLSGSPLELKMGAGNLAYQFTPTPVPGPGADASALRQFQAYPRHNVEGWGGIRYNRGFFGYEPLSNQQTEITPVISGTSGVVHGTYWLQPVAIPPTHNTTMG